MNEAKTELPTPTVSTQSGLLGEALVATVNGYMGDRRSLVEAIEKLSSYYDTYTKNKDGLVAEIIRIDAAVAKLLASPNEKLTDAGTKTL